MQEKMNNRLMTTANYILRLCCAVFFVSAIAIPGIFAQPMGGGMMGTGRGMRDSQNAQQSNNTEPPPPKHQNPFAIDAPPAEGLEARTAALENFIFGKAQKNLPMKVRVERLEKKLVRYEHHKPDEDLNERVNHLWSILAAANKSSEKPAAQ